MKNRIWFITGISSGLGQALAQEAISKGDFVIGTFRNKDQADLFTQAHHANAVGLVLDLNDHVAIDLTVKQIEDKYNRVDVLVNNAGFGFAGAVEEASMEEVRAVFETNFFGCLKLTQAFLPLFRKQKHGHIIQISSHGGFKAFAGFGIYNASKFALEGFSEALAQEIAPFGIKLTLVEPGPFRTNFAGSSFRMAEKSIADYHATAGAFRERMQFVNGKQEGDPTKAAHAIFYISKQEKPPLRLPLGKIALVSLNTKIELVQKDITDFQELATQAVYE